jgi:hypothetical protein
VVTLDGLANLQPALIWQGESNQFVTQNQPPIEKCELALDSSISEEGVDQISLLIDDEELELRELQEGTNLLICPEQLAASGMLGGSLCPGNFGENKYRLVLCVMF